MLVAGADGHPIYQLPIGLKEAVERFGLRIEVVQRELSPRLRGGKGAKELDGLAFDRVRQSWIAELEREGFQFDGVLSFDLPAGKEGRSAESILVTRRADEEGLRYGVATFSGLGGAAGGKAQQHERVAVFWDASASGASRDLEAEIACLTSYLKAVGARTVVLSLFHISVEEAQVFKAGAEGDWGGLERALAEVIYDGATQMGALDLGGVKADAVLVFGDGISTLGEPRSEQVEIAKTPVHVVGSAATAEHALLRGIASRSGGRYRSLAGQDPREVGRELAREDGVEVVLGLGDAARGVIEIVPEQVAIVDGKIALGVAFEGDSTEVEVILGDREGRETRRLKAVFAGDSGAEGKAPDALVRRLFAQRKIAGLQAEWPATRKEVVAVGQQFGVVTRGTSLLVLDRMEDYVRYEIPPPEPELRKEYLSLLKRRDTEEEKSRREHLRGVAARFKEFQKWYDESYPWLDDTNLQLAAAIQAAAGQAKLKKSVRAEADRMLASAKELKAGLAEAKEGSKEYAQLVRASTELSAELNKFVEKCLPAADRGRDSAEGRGLVLLGAADGGGGVGGVPPPRRSAPGAATPAPPAFSPAPSVDSAPFSSPAERNSEMVADAIDPFAPAGGEGLADRARGQGDGRSGIAGGISLAKWNPKTPYLKALKKAKPEAQWNVYAEQKEEHGGSPAFFLDISDLLRREGQNGLALRVLSNLAEMESENHALLRILGYRLLQLGQAELAVTVFEEILELREEEPQSHRDLAAAHAAAGDSQRAADLLWRVVRRSWDDRFPGIELIALHELNALLDRAGDDVRIKALPKGLRRGLPVDIRAVLTWTPISPTSISGSRARMARGATTATTGLEQAVGCPTTSPGATAPRSSSSSAPSPAVTRSRPTTTAAASRPWSAPPPSSSSSSPTSAAPARNARPPPSASRPRRTWSRSASSSSGWGGASRAGRPGRSVTITRPGPMRDRPAGFASPA